ncbi:hypothetical protein pEaSNUABM19_00072 [Erwinia phage pEa_SNUABM_19]|nr:hypothetical protein pEaSNUABM19_00072 [Erwinia phage pEa_SNUABM_19]
MIDLNKTDYVTILIEAAKILDGTLVQKPTGEVIYTLETEKPNKTYAYNDWGRYEKEYGMVYLKHENGVYYSYPKNKMLKVTIYKYDLQKYIDETCEY